MPPSQHALITGGAGFIGSHLAEFLHAGGAHVTVLDDFSTGRRENLSRLIGRERFNLVSDSVESESTVDTLVRDATRVFHLASAVGVKLIVDEPVRTIRTIIRGTETVLAACHRFGRPVLLTSSSEVYGKGSRVPFHEDDDIVMGPTNQSRWCYAYAKGIDEFLGLAYHRQYELPVTIVRLFNTVGPRQVGMYGMVLPRFVEAALKNQPLTVYGTGEQTRCFCHVADVATAIEQLSRTPAAVGRVFNVGGTEEVSMNDLAALVIGLTGSTSRIDHITYEAAYGQRFDDMPRRVPALDRVREAISFSPTFDLQQIVHTVIGDVRGRSATPTTTR
jgi:UDP-glucose 4-epimerase